MCHLAHGLSSRKPPAPRTVEKSKQKCIFRYPILWIPWSRYSHEAMERGREGGREGGRERTGATTRAGDGARGRRCARAKARDGARGQRRARAKARDGARGQRRAMEVAAPAYMEVGPPGPANSVLINFLRAVNALLLIVLAVSAILSIALVQLILQNHSISESSTQRRQQESLLIVFIIVGRE